MIKFRYQRKDKDKKKETKETNNIKIQQKQNVPNSTIKTTTCPSPIVVEKSYETNNNKNNINNNNNLNICNSNHIKNNYDNKAALINAIVVRYLSLFVTFVYITIYALN